MKVIVYCRFLFQTIALCSAILGKRKIKLPLSFWDLWKLNAKLLRDELFSYYATDKFKNFELDENQPIFQK